MPLFCYVQSYFGNWVEFETPRGFCYIRNYSTPDHNKLLIQSCAICCCTWLLGHFRKHLWGFPNYLREVSLICSPSSALSSGNVIVGSGYYTCCFDNMFIPVAVFQTLPQFLVLFQFVLSALGSLSSCSLICCCWIVDLKVPPCQLVILVISQFYYSCWIMLINCQYWWRHMF